jgi:hypothetical protein
MKFVTNQPLLERLPGRWAIVESWRVRFQPAWLLELVGNPSQIAIGSQKHRDPRDLTYAFTENGAIMAANVLKSREAVRVWRTPPANAKAALARAHSKTCRHLGRAM